MKQLICCFCSKRTKPENKRVITKEKHRKSHEYVEKKIGRTLDPVAIIHGKCKLQLFRICNGIPNGPAAQAAQQTHGVAAGQQQGGPVPSHDPQQPQPDAGQHQAGPAPQQQAAGPAPQQAPQQPQPDAGRQQQAGPPPQQQQAGPPPQQAPQQPQPGAQQAPGGPDLNLPPLPKRIKIPVSTASSARSHCLICQNKVKKGAVRLSKQAKLQVFTRRAIFVPKEVRVCKCHLLAEDSPYLKDEAIDAIKVSKQEAHVFPEEVADLLHQLRKEAKKHPNGIDFKNPDSLDDEGYYSLTGLHKEQFEDLYQTCKEFLGVERGKGTRNRLGILLVKLRTGLSHRVLATLFGVHKATITYSCRIAKNSLMTAFVPGNVGFEAVTRDSVINDHTTTLARHLFANGEKDQAILIADGTYIEVEKPGNHQLQKDTYSGQKKYNLVKPMCIVASDGHIVALPGPFLGRNNDATMTEHIAKMPQNGGDQPDQGQAPQGEQEGLGGFQSEFLKWLHILDILIVDRGFRDVKEFLERLGLSVFYPSFKARGESQLEDLEANKSRLVTKIRWVVEVVNARLKTWAFFSNVVPLSCLKDLEDYLLIVAALCNKYRPPLATDRPEDAEIAAEMLRLAEQRNTLKQLATEGLLRPRIKRGWHSMDATRSAASFPRMSEDEVRAITFGVYQVHQAKFYAEEHIKEGKYLFEVHDDVATDKVDGKVVRARIKSRHSGSVKYWTYVQFDDDTVKAWHCSCNAGSRVVGCCAHVTCIIWFLAYARYQPIRLSKRKFDCLLDAREAASDPENSDQEASDAE